MTTATSNGSTQRLVITPPDPPTALGGAEWRISEPAPVAELPTEEEVAVATAVAEGAPKEPDYRDAANGDPIADRTPAAGRVLDTQAIYGIVREVVAPHSGDAPYSAVADDRGAALGLCYGIALFPQASPHLGSVLRLMWLRDPRAFGEIMGPQASDLVAAASAPEASGRLVPVGGEPLWSEAWKQRFRVAGENAAFQAAQNEEAIENQVRPLLPVAAALGLATERLVAMLYEAAVSRGLGGGARWAVEACSPLRDAASRERVLRGLGFADLAAFQAGVEGLVADGVPTAGTHLALLGGAREHGLLPAPEPAELAGRMVALAQGGARERLLALVDSPRLTDAPLTEA
jgi:hypothetical protein